jgi:hypothetical protein
MPRSSSSGADCCVVHHVVIIVTSLMETSISMIFYFSLPLNAALGHFFVQELEDCNLQMCSTLEDLMRCFQAHGLREQDAADQISKGNCIIAQFTECLQRYQSKVERQQAVILFQVYSYM